MFNETFGHPIHVNLSFNIIIVFHFSLGIPTIPPTRTTRWGLYLTVPEDVALEVQEYTPTLPATLNGSRKQSRGRSDKYIKLVIN